MHFVRKPAEEAVAAVASKLLDALQGDKEVLWLVSGGSNIVSEIKVMEQLRQTSPDRLRQMVIMPMDERYGAPGHDDSNIEALRRAGFQPGMAEFVDILAANLPLEETLAAYDDRVSEAMATAHLILGQFGLGSDGHVAGILPDSPACAEDYSTVVGYKWHDYTRLTLSPRALTEITVGFVLAYGSEKAEALQLLQRGTEPLAQLPGRLLYGIAETYVYNDHIESEG